MNVSEYDIIAKQKLPKIVYDYYPSGAEDQRTLKENLEAFSRILFRSHILIDVSRIDMATSVLRFKISMPIMITATAMQKMAHPEGLQDRNVVAQLVKRAERAGFKAIVLTVDTPRLDRRKLISRTGCQGCPGSNSCALRRRYSPRD